MGPAAFSASAVYNVVRTIPKGMVCPYGRVGYLAWGVPGRARMVGRVMRTCADPAVPCHRVVFADGSLCDAFGPMGRMEWKALLESEGVPFSGPYRVDMKQAAWTGERA